MEQLIQEARKALALRLYLVALQTSLALIDIAAALDSESGATSGAKFQAWFERHLGHAYPRLSSQDVWRLRCGMLHQGRAASHQYDAIVFTLPGGPLVHDNLVDRVYNLDLAQFCEDILSAVQFWWRIGSLVEPVKSNSDTVIRYRPDGFFPYFVGRPVLA